MNGETIRDFAGTARTHVALGVHDVEKSRRFYESMLGVPPAKVRAGYAKFELREPALNLSLNERPGASAPDGVAHFGIELRSTRDVAEAALRLERVGLSPRREKTTCCFAVQEKAWVRDPDGHEWEFFVVLADADEARATPSPADRSCCAATCCADEGR